MLANMGLYSQASQHVTLCLLTVLYVSQLRNKILLQEGSICHFLRVHIDSAWKIYGLNHEPDSRALAQSTFLSCGTQTVGHFLCLGEEMYCLVSCYRLMAIIFTLIATSTKDAFPLSSQGPIAGWLWASTTRTHVNQRGPKQRQHVDTLVSSLWLALNAFQCFWSW